LKPQIAGAYGGCLRPVGAPLSFWALSWVWCGSALCQHANRLVSLPHCCAEWEDFGRRATGTVAPTRTGFRHRHRPSSRVPGEIQRGARRPPLCRCKVRGPGEREIEIPLPWSFFRPFLSTKKGDARRAGEKDKPKAFAKIPCRAVRDKGPPPRGRINGVPPTGAGRGVPRPYGTGERGAGLPAPTLCVTGCFR
jgi:hypothetical protein